MKTICHASKSNDFVRVCVAGAVEHAGDQVERAATSATSRCAAPTSSQRAQPPTDHGDRLQVADRGSLDPRHPAVCGRGGRPRRRNQSPRRWSRNESGCGAKVRYRGTSTRFAPARARRRRTARFVEPPFLARTSTPVRGASNGRSSGTLGGPSGLWRLTRVRQASTSRRSPSDSTPQSAARPPTNTRRQPGMLQPRGEPFHHDEPADWFSCVVYRAHRTRDSRLISAPA